MKQDVYQKVTDKIIADLEQGELTWLKPRSAGNMDGRVTKPLRHNGLAYSGINVLMLWGAAMEAGYCSPYWMTYRQAQELGAHVRKGERGNPVVYANTITKTEEQDNGTEEERTIPFMKAYTVFNVEQIEGLPEHYYDKPEPVIDPAQRIAHAEDFFAATGADVRHGGNQAFYSGGSDHVQMPVFECFRSPEAYYATLAHELTHWTKHPKRLDREFGRKKWGDEGYAREELVAELGAAFLCADLGLTPEAGTDHAAYASGRFATQVEVKRFLERQPSFPKDLPGGEIRNQRIYDMLTRVIYAGYVEAPNWNVSIRKGQHEGLISFETFEKIQARLKGKAKAAARKDISADFPLRGFVLCNDCDKPLTACWSQGKKQKYPYYLCPTKGCPSYRKSIKRDELEGEFEGVLQSLQPTEGLFALVKAMFRDAWDMRLAQASEATKGLKTNIKQL